MATTIELDEPTLWALQELAALDGKTADYLGTCIISQHLQHGLPDATRDEMLKRLKARYTAEIAENKTAIALVKRFGRTLTAEERAALLDDPEVPLR